MKVAGDLRWQMICTPLTNIILFNKMRSHGSLTVRLVNSYYKGGQMLKESSKCATCEKRNECVSGIMASILRNRRRGAAAVFDAYEAGLCRLEVLPFLAEKIDEQLIESDGEARADWLCVSGFTARLNALDTLVREANEGEGLSSVKQKIGVNLLLDMIGAHHDIGQAVLAQFYFQKNWSLGDLVQSAVTNRLAEVDRDESAVKYDWILWHTAEVQKSARRFDEKIAAMTSRENDFWDSAEAVKVEATELIMDHLRVAESLPDVANVFLHSVMSRFVGLNRELHANIVAAAADNEKFRALLRFYERKRERDMARYELNGIIALHGEFQNSLPWEKRRALDLIMKLFALCDDAGHAGDYLRQMQHRLPKLFVDICGAVKTRKSDSTLLTDLATQVEPLLAVHARMTATYETLEKFFKKGTYTEDELRALVDTSASVGASAAFSLLVFGKDDDFAKVFAWLKEKSQTDLEYKKAHEEVELRREFLKAMRDHLRRTYGQIIGEEQLAEEDDVFGKPKGKYVN